MTTIKDVAKYAGVSIASASYGLNGTGTICAATRKRVLEAAEKLNYHPNAFARNLKKPKTRTIGVFITRFGGSFYEEILEGIHDAILKTDYELIVCPESRPVRKILAHRQVDGAIVFDSKIKSDILIKLASKKFPIVVLDRYLEGEYLFPLLVDNKQGAKEVFYHLFDQGARRIFFISGASDSFDNMERMKAFLNEAKKNKVSIECFYGNFTEQSGYDVAGKIFGARNFPEAVFCANDQMAIGFIKAMKENGLRAPEDISVVGFDDIQIAKYMQPTLSTIGASRFLWGSSAATQLINFLENEKPFHLYRIPIRLIQRESSVVLNPGLPAIKKLREYGYTEYTR
jgi:LacI family transcriptional regulator, galactose operon repressor